MTDDYSYKLALIFTVPCTTCGAADTPAPTEACAGCCSQLPTELVATVRGAIKLRRQTFKGRIAKLQDSMSAVDAKAKQFATQGVPLAPDQYRDQVLRPAIQEAAKQDSAIVRLLTNTQWDDQKSGCISAFSQLVGLLEVGFTAVAELARVMPPLEWRAAHRELTRGAVSQVRGHIRFTQVLAAPDLSSARQLLEEGQRLLATSARHAERVRTLIAQAGDLPSEGPFLADGSVDIATLTWVSVGQRTTTIADAAKIVRSAYDGVPSLEDVPDYYAVLLLPILAASVCVVDHDLLIARTRQLRAVLDEADSLAKWVIESDLLVERMWYATSEITKTTERLGREWRHGLPRHHLVNSLTEIYRQLAEGALRALGGIVLVADRTNRSENHSSYERTVVEGIQAGEVADLFERLGGPCNRAVDMLYRNANAHAHIKITDTGIIATERRIRDHRVEDSDTVELTDAQFAEQVASLQETLLALQLTILAWAWSPAQSDLGASLASIPPEQSEMARTLAFLGGMAGLHDINTSIVGDHLAVTAKLLHDDSDRRETGILTLASVIFDLAPAIDRLTLTLSGLNPVTFERGELAVPGPQESPHALPLLALSTAKWLVQSNAGWTTRDEATYVTFPLTIAHFASMRLAGNMAQDIGNADRAVESLRFVRARLDEILPPEKQSPLTVRAVVQLDKLATCLARVAAALHAKSQLSELLALTQEADATHEPMYTVQEEAKALRDQHPGEAG